MTGAEVPLAAAALSSGVGAAALGAGTALGAGAAGGIISATEAAALGLTAEAGAAAAAQGLTAAEVAAAASTAEAGAAATTAEAGGGLLASSAPETTGLLTQGEMLAAQNAGLEGAGQATGEALLSNQQAAMLAEQNTGLLGAEQSTQAAADPALTQGMQQPWHQQAGDWLGQKPLGESGPSRGKMISQGVKTAATPQEQQQQADPPPPRQPGQFVPSAPVSPYAAQGASPYPFQATTQAPSIMGRPYIGMSQYMRRG